MVRDDVDTLVYSYGGRSVDDLFRALEGKVPELENVGDSYAPRSLHHSIMSVTRRMDGAGGKM